MEWICECISSSFNMIFCDTTTINHQMLIFFLVGIQANGEGTCDIKVCAPCIQGEYGGFYTYNWMGKCVKEVAIWWMHQERWEDLVQFDYPCHDKNLVQSERYSFYGH
jgi:hypothetical protein